MPTTVRSHAKINLGLYIGAPRADSFHALTTVYQTLELHDLVTVAARPAAGMLLIYGLMSGWGCRPADQHRERAASRLRGATTRQPLGQSGWDGVAISSKRGRAGDGPWAA
jgi:4-diphosphocytidyl-2C-methyl-D-erythritol kinase